MAEDVAVEKKETKASTAFNLDEMMEAGLHFGHRTSKTHPKMQPYIAGIRNTIHIINLEKTSEKLQEALEVMKEFIAGGKTILLVGTKVQIKKLVKETAEACGLPYVSERWIGGLLTNFDTISKRIEYLKELVEKTKSEEFGKYTKKEQHDMAEEIRILEIKFGGVKNLSRLPNALFVVDLDKNGLAVREAKRKGIDTIAIADTNTDPTSVDYPIPANDDAVSSVRYILGKVQETILVAKSKIPHDINQQN